MATSNITPAIINQSFLQVEKIDTQVKMYISKLLEFKEIVNRKKNTNNLQSLDISSISKPANMLLENYSKYLDEIKKHCNDITEGPTGTSTNTNNINYEFLEKYSVAKENYETTKKSFKRHFIEAKKIEAEIARLNLLGANNNYDIDGNGYDDNDNITSSLRHRKPKPSTGKSQLKETINVNSTLANLNSIMESTMAGSAKTIENLVNQTEIMTKTKNETENQNNYIEDGIRLLNKYKQREKTDKILIYLGLVTFFMTCAYILLKRLFGFFL